MILDTTRRRTSPRRFLVLAAVAGAAVLVPLSMLRPAAQAAPVAGTPQTTQQARSSGAPPSNGALEAQYALENGRFVGGQGLSPREVSVLEQQIAAEPNDYAAHLRLLGYYLNSVMFGKPLSFATARPAYRQQVFWLIQNHPESLLFSREPLWVPRHYAPAMFQGDEALWQEQVARHPSSALILGNAAGYSTISDKALVEKYLLQAQALEPYNPEWPERLGEAYRLTGPKPSAAVITQSAKKALAEYELSATLTNRTSQPGTSVQPNTSPDLAETAFDAGEYAKAKEYAEDLLKRGQNKQGYNPDSDIYVANQVLGRLALRSGDVAGAEAHLLAMGHVSGSGIINATSPMQLSKELLEHGDRPPVVAFFDDCTRIYEFPISTPVLRKWKAEVQQGKIPDFSITYLS